MQLIADHDRNFWAVERKPADVFRIVCLGDSLTYGSGILPEETLPAHLEDTLNRALWDSVIEVLNEGVSGYSLYDDWHRFVHRGQRLKPDLVIIILSENDVHLFSTSALHRAGKSIEYREHVVQGWQEDSLHYRHFCAALSNIKIQMAENNIPVILAFYDIWDVEVRPLIVSRLQELAERLGLDLVDLSAEFAGVSAATEHSEYRASAADVHPSGVANQIAARALARHIIERKYVPAPEESNEFALYKRIIGSIEKMHELGYSADFLHYRLGRLLELKRTSRRRLMLSEAGIIPDDRYAELQKDLRRRSAGSYYLLFWEAYCRALNAFKDEFFVRLTKANDLIRWISTALFVLGNKVADDAFPLYNFFPGNSGPADLVKLENAVISLNEWRVRLTAARKILSALPDEQPSGESLFLKAMEVSWFVRYQAIVGQIELYWKELEMAIDSALNMHDFYSCLFKRAHSERDEGIAAALTGLGMQLTNLAELLAGSCRLMSFDKIMPYAAEFLRRPITTCSLRLKSASPVPFTVWISIDSQVPAQRPRQDMKWVICDGQQHTYNFEFPLFFYGRLGLALSPRAGVEIDSLKIYNNSARPLSLTPKNSELAAKGNFISPVFLLAP